METLLQNIERIRGNLELLPEAAPLLYNAQELRTTLEQIRGNLAIPEDRGLAKDWNEEFVEISDRISDYWQQRIIELPQRTQEERLDRYERICQISRDFEHCGILFQ